MTAGPQQSPTWERRWVTVRRLRVRSLERREFDNLGKINGSLKHLR